MFHSILSLIPLLASSALWATGMLTDHKVEDGLTFFVAFLGLCFLGGFSCGTMKIRVTPDVRSKLARMLYSWQIVVLALFVVSFFSPIWLFLSFPVLQLTHSYVVLSFLDYAAEDSPGAESEAHSPC